MIPASDASGRYRGQFLFGNDLWVGSLVICNELENIDEMDLSFYIATVSLMSTEPLMKVNAAIAYYNNNNSSPTHFTDAQIFLAVSAAGVSTGNKIEDKQRMLH